MLEQGSGRASNPEATALATAREVMKPFRKKVSEWNDEMVRINMLKERAERRVASGDLWQRQALALVALIANERKVFLAAVEKLPPKIADAAPVGDVDSAIKRLLTNLAALEPVRKQLTAQGRANRE